MLRRHENNFEERPNKMRRLNADGLPATRPRRRERTLEPLRSPDGWVPNFWPTEKWQASLAAEPKRAAAFAKRSVALTETGIPSVELIRNLPINFPFVESDEGLLWFTLRTFMHLSCFIRPGPYLQLSWNGSHIPEAYGVFTYDLRVMLSFVLIPRSDLKNRTGFTPSEFQKAEKLRNLMGGATCILLSQDFFVVIHKSGSRSEQITLGADLAEILKANIDADPPLSVRPSLNNCRDLSQ